MRFLFVFCVTAIVFSGYCTGEIDSFDEDNDEYDIDLLENHPSFDLALESQNDKIEIQPLFVISWKVRSLLRDLRNQMQYGFPEYNIPPLAPFEQKDAEVNVNKGILSTSSKLSSLRVDGLDDFEIEQLKLNILTKKIKFNFVFKNIQAASEYETNTLLDAMQQLGLSAKYEGSGFLNIGLQNLRISGVLKYKIGVLWGSARITSLKTVVSLEKFDSNVELFKSIPALNSLINRKTEGLVEKTIAERQTQISDLIENALVPVVNSQLKGIDIWVVIDKIFSRKPKEN